jgi:SPP1 family predicted phage head-tail adaptor
MRRRLVLEAPTESADGAGGVTRSFAAVATLWATLEPVAARAEVTAERSGQAITHRITIRRRMDVTAAHRFTEDARLFEIRGIVDADEAGRYLIIEAEEVRP